MLPFFSRLNSVLNIKKIEERHRTEEKEPLEKGDLPAMLIAAFIVFAPVILLLILITWLLSRFFLR